MRLALAVVLGMTTWFSASAVLPQLRSEWGISDSTGAWLTIAVQLGFVAGALLSSTLNLSDIVSSRVVIVGAATGAAIANACLLFANGPELGIPIRFATGFFLAGVYPPALKLISTWYVTGRGVALGVLVGALTIGSATPHLVNGFGGLDPEVVIVSTSALTFVGGLVAFLTVAEGPFPFPKAIFDPRQSMKVFANRKVRLASLGYFGHMWELYAMWAWFVVFFASTTEPGTAPAFATFAVIGIGGAGCVIGGFLGDRWGRERTTILMMVISGVCAVVVGLLLSGPAWLLLIVSLIWGLTVVADSAQFSALVTEHADPAYVGTALTLQMALGFTLTVATIWLIPIWEDAYTWRWAFAWLAPGPILGIVAMLRLRRLALS